MTFPHFDLGAFEAATGMTRRARAAEIDAICRDTGFLVLTGHGVPDATIASVWRAVQTFFALDPDARRQVAAPYPGYPYGYLGPDKEALAKSRGVATPPDLKESFNGGPLATPPGIDDPDALAFFHQPDWDAVIAPLDGSATYPAVKSGPYLMEKFRASGG